MTLPPEHPAHGTTTGYANHACRCQRCREAHREKHNAYMHRVRQTGELTTPDRTHGTAYRYDVGCRCDDCRAAHNLKSRLAKARRRDSRRQDSS